MKDEKKTMTVSKNTWLRLTYLKLNRDVSTLDDLLNYLMDREQE